MAFYDFLNIIFAPLLMLPPVLAVVILAFIVSLIIILITKYTTDQALMKKLKDDMKEYQKQIKDLRGVEPAKAMESQKKTMELNMKYMGHSLKPTIITFIPIILIFGWMSSTFAYESINPNQEFTVTVFFNKNTNGSADIIVPEGVAVIGDVIKKIENEQATWTLKAAEGEHILEFVYDNEKQQHTVLITNSNKYTNPVRKTIGAINSIKIDYRKLIVLPIGYKDWFGWLGTYIISSLIFTMILRKAIKVY